MASPLEQFAIQDLTAPLFTIGGHHIAVTNSAVFMMGAVVLSSGLLLAGAGKGAMIPGRIQAMSELFYEFIANMIRDNVGSGGKKFFPFIFTLFIFTLFGNILGMLPYGYTFTSQIAVTFFMAMVVFLGVTLIGLFKHGLHFFSLFFPHGAPLFTAPILIPIELVSYLSRPISLSVRLFANMTVGHVLLKVLAGFVVALGIFGVVPLVVLVAITALELLVALLQAYIFTILCCIYLNDALHLH
ncbi:F0F1 ATP synthase subunit A [Reyranella sp.]|uniref:F0F1 ATP synthase subunit A n=1 Tax=Reyranella sp. TaxID=1929291 RepID=UPI000BCF2D5B|nr:F0F1 ATP synthase subunit A [Reyranella sp.]OYY33947.1 MAG: F0F1 ATP synthase subunit A [Rhodospirillales bacterium 35-66-84]OYZ90719.1 MAG: F0F1 ATP synthase subunit A [Rhodospirillales bacterium 24-66-33]OZB21039.1 MAG: F0F1 ATP synthase subunit A [Rhodospirillales bacterium 39-66-50]HQS19235.1 F0F1 ATP synthase subunit A [Reyranella sp.]HQT15506.1 F0F1 ATP synthase subunit A [Reyranella sp.]